MTLKLGVTTDSGDADGKITTQQDASSITDDAIDQNTQSLTGDIEQIPPMYSALKHPRHQVV